jgi:membrane protein DedA with SNARE-associated domain
MLTAILCIGCLGIGYFAGSIRGYFQGLRDRRDAPKRWPH